MIDLPERSIARWFLLVFVIVLGSFMLANPAFAIQFARPNGIAAGTWADDDPNKINESIRNDADFITSQVLGWNQDRKVTFTLSGVLDPPERDHIVRYSFKENNLGSNSPSLIVNLKQGDTVIDSWTESSPLPISFIGTSHSLSSEKIKLISNYGDLRIEFVAHCDPSICPSNLVANRDSVSVSWAELQVPSLDDVVRPPPTILGVGLYKINTEISDDAYKPEAQEKPGFAEFFPYSKRTDVSDKENYGDLGSFEKSGTFFKIDDRKTSSLFLGEVNQPIQLQIQLQDLYASNQIEHLSLFTDVISYSSSSVISNIELSFEKGQLLVVRDVNNLLKSVKAFSSLEDGFLWVNFDLVFQKPLKKSDIILQSWHESKIPSFAQISGAWEILESIKLEPQEVTLVAEVEITHDASSPICKTTNSCFIPFEAKILKGGIVTWINTDDSVHTVESGTPEDGSLNIFEGTLMPGKIYQKQFLTSGTFRYYCDIHPWATGVVIVYEDGGDVTQSQLEYDKKALMVSTTTQQGSLIIENDDHLISVVRDLNLIVSGNLEGVASHKMIQIIIKKPDGSEEKISTHTNDRGYFYVPIKLAKHWLPGTYEIISKYHNVEIGRISFDVSD